MNNQLGDLLRFAAKTAIVAGVISICAVFVFSWMVYRIEIATDRTAGNLRELGGRQFWSKLENELDHAADPASDLPAEKKAKLIANIRVIVARWRPLLDAITTDGQKPVVPARPAN